MCGPELGQKAPAFSVETDAGETISLANYRGQKLVLYYYPKDDTPGCTKEAIGFSEYRQKFEDAGTAILGVSKDTVEKHQNFKAKYDLGITLASDPRGQMIEAYGSWVEKNMYGRKYMGIDRSTFLIDEKGIVQEVWRKVRVPGHVGKVLARVKEL